MSFNDLIIKEYTDRSVAVQGDTHKYKEDLKKLGGKYNGNLKNGPGWIFPKSKLNELKTFAREGKRLVIDCEIKEEVVYKKKESVLSFSASPTITEFCILLNLLKEINTRTETLEKAIGLLLSNEQKEKLNVMLNPVIVQKVQKVTVKIPEKNESDNDSDSDSPPPRRLLR